MSFWHIRRQTVWITIWIGMGTDPNLSQSLEHGLARVQPVQASNWGACEHAPPEHFGQNFAPHSSGIGASTSRWLQRGAPSAHASTGSYTGQHWHTCIISGWFMSTGGGSWGSEGTEPLLFQLGISRGHSACLENLQPAGMPSKYSTTDSQSHPHTTILANNLHLKRSRKSCWLYWNFWCQG